MRRYTTILFIILLFGCAKNKKGVCLKSAGPIDREERELNDFTSIVLSDRIDLVLTQDSVNSATVVSGENLIPGIITEVHGDTLHIYEENRCNWARSYKTTKEVQLNVADLRWIKQLGAGKVTTTNTISGSSFGIEVWDASGDATIDLQVDTSYALVHTGPADITYTGSANVCFLYCASSGFIDHEYLNSTTANINNSGISDFTVNASNELVVEIYLSGNVYYKGSPQTITEYNEGSGKLEPLN